jgi:hypothetical protein
MDFFKNLKVSLQATGTAAFLSVLVICITLIGLFGHGPLANTALGILSFALGLTGTALGRD